MIVPRLRQELVSMLEFDLEVARDGIAHMSYGLNLGWGGLGTYYGVYRVLGGTY